MNLNFLAKIYTLTNQTPFNKDYGLRNQIQRAVVSISANISEGEERDTNRQKIHFFRIAKASNAEVFTLL